MKKIFTIVLTALLFIGLAACGGQPQSSQPAEDEIKTTEKPTVTESADNNEKTDHPAPQVQDIQKFLALDTPYDVDMGTFGSMDFLYSLESGQEVLMQQFMDVLVGEDYGLSLVDIFTYDYETATFKDYRYSYSGDGEDKLQRENMNWDVSVGITVHKDKPEVTAGVFYVNGFELVDDGHRADYSKVITAAPTTAPTPVPTEKPAVQQEQSAAKHGQSAAQQPSHNTTPSASVDKNAAYIPEFSAFLNHNPSEEKDRYYGGTRKYYQKLPLDTQQTVVTEVLALLNSDRYQLELIEKVDNDNRIEYNYRYTGNVGMDSIHSKNDDTRYYNLQFTIYNKNNGNGTYGIHFHYAPQFAEENVGYTVSANIAGGGGSGGSTPNFEGNDLPEHSKLPCLTCDGSGDCDDCGGSIYVYVGGTRTKCNGCKGTGNCRTCGGSGTRG